MKGIVLAGGSGTRLYPMTRVVSKQLMPVYDKPMIFYPVSVLMQAGIDEILIIATPAEMPRFQELLGSGVEWGIRFSYVVQEHPDGLAQAFTLGAQFIDSDACALVLGDNIFVGEGLSDSFRRAAEKQDGATVYAYHVADARSYGVVTIDEHGKAVKIVEKPAEPESNWAVTGLYFYDNRVVDFARKVKPSHRGEYEITDINRMYMEAGDLHVECMGKQHAWFDTGTPDSLMEAAEFIRSLTHRQGLKICCPEEIAFRQKFIDGTQLEKVAEKYGKSDYGKYLRRLASGE